MAQTIILLRNNELTKNSIIGGNVDPDRWLPAVKAAQKTEIKQLLGPELYSKIETDFNTIAQSGLTGLYLELYENFLVDLITHKSSEIYLSTGAYLVTNNGITKSFSDSSETVSKEEVDYLVHSSRKLYEMYKNDFLKWIKVNGNSIPEWENDIKPSIKYINPGGWFVKRVNKNCNE